MTTLLPPSKTVLTVLHENASAITVKCEQTTGTISAAAAELATEKKKAVVFLLDEIPWVVMPSDPPTLFRDRWFRFCDDNRQFIEDMVSTLTTKNTITFTAKKKKTTAKKKKTVKRSRR